MLAETIKKMNSALKPEIIAALEAKLAQAKGAEYKLLIPAILTGDTSQAAAFKNQSDLKECLKNISKNFFRITHNFGESMDAYHSFAEAHNVGSVFSDTEGFKCHEYLISE